MVKNAGLAKSPKTPHLSLRAKRSNLVSRRIFRRLPRRFAPRNDGLGLFTVKIPLDPPLLKGEDKGSAETPPYGKGGPGGIFMRGGGQSAMTVYEAIKIASTIYRETECDEKDSISLSGRNDSLELLAGGFQLDKNRFCDTIRLNILVLLEPCWRLPRRVAPRNDGKRVIARSRRRRGDLRRTAQTETANMRECV